MHWLQWHYYYEHFRWIHVARYPQGFLDVQDKSPPKVKTMWFVRLRVEFHLCMSIVRAKLQTCITKKKYLEYSMNLIEVFYMNLFLRKSVTLTEKMNPGWVGMKWPFPFWVSLLFRSYSILCNAHFWKIQWNLMIFFMVWSTNDDKC